MVLLQILVPIGLLVVVVVVAVLSSTCASRGKVDIEKFSETSRVDTSDFPDAKAVILLDRTEVTYWPPAGKDSVIAEVISTRRTQIRLDRRTS